MSFRITLSDLEWLIEICNDKARAVSLRQLSFLLSGVVQLMIERRRWVRVCARWLLGLRTCSCLTTRGSVMRRWCVYSNIITSMSKTRLRQQTVCHSQATQVHLSSQSATCSLGRPCRCVASPHHCQEHKRNSVTIHISESPRSYLDLVMLDVTTRCLSVSFFTPSGRVMWWFVLSVCLPVCLSVCLSKLSHERENGHRSNMIGMGKGWASTSDNSWCWSGSACGYEISLFTSTTTRLFGSVTSVRGLRLEAWDRTPAYNKRVGP